VIIICVLVFISVILLFIFLLKKVSQKKSFNAEDFFTSVFESLKDFDLGSDSDSGSGCGGCGSGCGGGGD
jgi:hypothetical protein